MCFMPQCGSFRLDGYDYVRQFDAFRSVGQGSVNEYVTETETQDDNCRESSEQTTDYQRGVSGLGREDRLAELYSTGGCQGFASRRSPRTGSRSVPICSVPSHVQVADKKIRQGEQPTTSVAGCFVFA